MNKYFVRGESYILFLITPWYSHMAIALLYAGFLVIGEPYYSSDNYDVYSLENASETSYLFLSMMITIPESAFSA